MTQLHASISVGLIAALCSFAACKSGGPGEAEEPEVVLFGHDPGMPKKAPADCKKVGKIEASSIGQDSFPEDALRAQALDLGANGVTRIRHDGMEDVLLGRKVYFRATAVLCKKLPHAASSAAASAAPAPEDTAIPDMGP